MTEKRFSLAEALDQTESAKHNSDMANLAQALVSVKNYRKDLNLELLALDVIEKDILALAARIEAGEEVDVKEVRAVYEAARGTLKPERRVR